MKIVLKGNQTIQGRWFGTGHANMHQSIPNGTLICKGGISSRLR